MRPRTSFIFDLDGTLVDSVYQHVLAWHEAIRAEGFELSVWRIHRKIGMSGGLFANMLLREIGASISEDRIERIQRGHTEAYKRVADTVASLPGSRELLEALTKNGVPWAIATSSHMESASRTLRALGVDLERTVLVTRDEVKHAKPDPDLFFAAAEKLSVPVETASIVGDSVWDMLAAQRARALGIGLLSGGYGPEELERAGAYRVYADPQDLLDHLDEVGGRQ